MNPLKPSRYTSIMLFFLLPFLTLAENNSNDILQFRSAGHVIGFTSTGTYIASGNHLLRTSFVQATPCVPVTDNIPLCDTDNQPLQTVRYSGLWTGIHLTYESVAGGIVKSTYVIDPGANVEKIRFTSNVPVSINVALQLVYTFPNGQLTETEPVAWQVIKGKKVPVSVAYALHAGNEVGFSIGEYDPSHPLTIDPTMFWNTFFGGDALDQGEEICMDSEGNIYVTGFSYSTWGSPISSYQGGGDAFVAKLSNSGSLVWSTFLGGWGEDRGHSIDIDPADGSIYVSGQSREPWGSPVAQYQGQWDGFVARLSSSGILQWNSFVGGISSDESVYGITISGSTLYMTGGKFQYGLPAPGFIGKMSTSGTITGYDEIGSAGTIGFAVKVSPSGLLYLFGRTAQSWNTSDWWGSPLVSYQGGDDAFLAAFNSSAVFGSSPDHGLQWYTFMGSGASEWGYGLCVDDENNAYVAGYGEGTWGSPVSGYTGSGDAFLAKYNSAGTRQWNTFLCPGDNAFAWAASVRSGPDGIVYLGGSYNGYPFVARYEAGTGTLVRNFTMAGTNTSDGARDAVYQNGYVYAVGGSYTSWGSPRLPYAGGEDAFVAKIWDPENIQAPVIVVCHNGNTILTSPSGVQAHLNHGDYLGECIVPKRSGASPHLALSLNQNYPNPFGGATLAGNPSTAITYAIPQDCLVLLRVYDVFGRIVSTLENGIKDAGSHRVIFDAKDLPNGMYFYRLEANDQVLTGTMTLMK